MAAPQVQTLADVMAQLDPAFAGQTEVIQKQQQSLGAKYDAQRSGLAAEKGQGFNAINNQATGRGLSFSGIPIDEQATYLSTKYLPGVQQANYQQNADNLTLQGQIAQINTQKTTQALGRIDQQQSALNAWNLQQEQLAATARENALNRAAEASNAAASRAATASSNQVNVYDTVESMLQNAMGADRKVSPAAWKQAVAYASRNGLGFSGKNGFASSFWQYANDKHWQDYKNGYDQYN